MAKQRLTEQVYEIGKHFLIPASKLPLTFWSQADFSFIPCPLHAREAVGTGDWNSFIHSDSLDCLNIYMFN